MVQRYEKIINLLIYYLSIEKGCLSERQPFELFLLFFNLLEVVSYAEAKGTTITKIYLVSYINTLISFTTISSMDTCV